MSDPVTLRESILKIHEQLVEIERLRKLQNKLVENSTTCPKCGGEGTIGREYSERTCENCSGLGAVDDEPWVQKFIPKRSCNRHDDCDKAEEECLARNPGKTKKDISFSFHCHNDECEECFGN